MTYGEVIRQCDELVENDLSEEHKVQLLSELECSIMLDVMMLSLAEVEALPEPTADTELCVKRPHSKIYRLWLCSMLHKANGDYNDAANVTADYDAARCEFVQWYGRNTAPGRGQAEYKGYYLSAYALAVLYGYTGTVEEWLLSLRGAPGDKGDAYVITDEDYAEIAAYCAEHYDEKVAEMTAVLEKAKNVSITAVGGDEAGVIVSENEDSVTLAFTVPKGADGHTPEKGVDYMTQADKGELFNEMFCFKDGSAAICSILNFTTEENFEANKQQIWSNDWLAGAQSAIVFINNVPRYYWNGSVMDDYVPAKFPMLDSEKEELKAYTDEKLGEVESALDELHAYALALSGGEA